MTEAKSKKYVRWGHMAASARVTLRHLVMTNVELQATALMCHTCSIKSTDCLS
jgi:hypothetical protein